MNLKWLSQDPWLCSIAIWSFQLKTSLWDVLRKLHKSSWFHLKIFKFSNSLSHPTWHITLTLKIFPLLQKLVTHILSVTYGLMVHLFEAAQKISCIYHNCSNKVNLSQNIFTFYLIIWSNLWKSFCMFYNVKWEAVFQGY